MFKIICMNCFKYAKSCKCVKKYLVEIDSNIFKTIMILNKKGYTTRFCCGGHVDLDFIYIYIYFTDKYKFKLPDEFKLKNAEHGCYIYYKNSKVHDVKQKNKILKDKIKVLEQWAKTL